MHNRHSRAKKRYIKQFRSNGTSYSKARKLTIISDVSPAFAYEYEWKANSTPFIWVNNNEVAIGNKVFSLNPSLAYGLCQKALADILTEKKLPIKENTDENNVKDLSKVKKLESRTKKFFETDTFKTLSREEQLRLIMYISQSSKFDKKMRQSLLNDKSWCY